MSFVIRFTGLVLGFAIAALGFTMFFSGAVGATENANLPAPRAAAMSLSIVVLGIVLASTGFMVTREPRSR